MALVDVQQDMQQYGFRCKSHGCRKGASALDCLDVLVKYIDSSAREPLLLRWSLDKEIGV